MKILCVPADARTKKLPHRSRERCYSAKLLGKTIRGFTDSKKLHSQFINIIYAAQHNNDIRNKETGQKLNKHLSGHHYSRHLVQEILKSSWSDNFVITANQFHFYLPVARSGAFCITKFQMCSVTTCSHVKRYSIYLTKIHSPSQQHNDSCTFQISQKLKISLNCLRVWTCISCDFRF